MPFRYTFNTPGENEQETLDLSVKMDWDLGFADLVAYLAYNDLEEYLLSDGTSATFFGYEFTPTCQNDRVELNSLARPDLFGPLYDPFAVWEPSSQETAIYGPYTATACDGYQYQERNQEDISIDARLVSPGSENLRWIAGLYVAEIEREVVVAYGADQGQGFLRQPYVPADGPNPTDLLFWDDFDTTVYAVYGQLEFDLTETFELAFAARYDYEDREVSNKVPNADNSGLNGNLNNPLFSGNPVPLNPALVSNPDGIPDRDDSFSHFQPKVTLNWATSDDINLYASYGVGFRSGGFNSVGTEDLLNFWFNTGYGGPGELVDAELVVSDDYDKEVSTTYEIGLKSELLDGRLRLNAAVFRNDVEDNQFFEFFAGPFGLLRTVTTIDEMYVQGFEADFQWLATEGLTFYGGIGMLDSEIEENKNRPLSEGNDVPQAPDTTGNLGAQWVLPISGNMNLVSRLDWQYVGETWFHTLQGEQTPTIWNFLLEAPGVFQQDFSKASRDAYDTLNLRIGLEAENWTVTAWGRNITDEEYLEEVIPAPEFGGSFNHQSGLRSYGLDFSYSF
jgi:iron complex outermembrane receptor protein